MLGAVGTVRILEIDAQDVYRGVDQRIGTGIVDFSTISTSVWLETAKNDAFFDFAPEASNFKNSELKMHAATRWLRCDANDQFQNVLGPNRQFFSKIDQNVQKS